MIQFYLERQPDDLLKASFFGDDNESLGITKNISVEGVDSAIEDIFPAEEKKQIFDLPKGI